MSQPNLFGDDFLTLDSTCSDFRMWPKTASIRMDIRREVKPDIVASACALPFRDGIFSIIYCDPPHVIRPGWKEKPEVGRFFASTNRRQYATAHAHHTMKRYGHWKSREEWLEFIVGTDKEFSRCLKADGFVEYKICHGGGKKTMVELDDLKRMTSFSIDEEKETFASRYGRNPTVYLTMRRKT